MKTAVYTAQGTFEVRDVPRPEAIAGHAVVQVQRAGICGSDLHVFHIPPASAFHVMGHEFAGTVVDPGDTGLLEGDRVVVSPVNDCGHCDACRRGLGNCCTQNFIKGMGFGNAAAPGAYAQYISVRGDKCLKLPDTVSFAEAALVEPAAVSLRGVRRSGIVAGQSAVIIGGGTIGQFAARFARLQGASFIALIERNLEKAKKPLERGDVDAVFHTDDPELTKKLLAANGGRAYDTGLECHGNGESYTKLLSCLKVGGVLSSIGVGDGNIAGFKYAVLKEISLRGSMEYSMDDFEAVLRLIAIGILDVKPYISREISLEAVQQAFTDLMREDCCDVKVLIDPSL